MNKINSFPIDDILVIIEKELNTTWLGLRPELVLHHGDSTDTANKTWILEDPVQGNYFEIGNEEAQFILCMISEPDIKAAIYKLHNSFSLNPSLQDVIRFLKMLNSEKLLVSDVKKDSERAKVEIKTKWLQTLFNIYLFFKIPLFRPDTFLTSALPWARLLWSKFALSSYALISAMGVLFLFQQWELYWNTISHSFTPLGIFCFFLALWTVKTMHEFGHTFAAKAHGLFVRRMGIAFIVFMPILYCDVSDAWRLNSRKGRLIIGSAGILTELIAAGIALFIWSVSTDGIIKSMMFYISSASIVSSIFTNMNPLMRYDAYYLVMDYLKVSNLRTRSLNLYNYFTRRILVDWQAPIPEVHPKYKLLVGFGFLSRMYLIFIFTAITITVYHFFFKALGVVLALGEIVLIVLLPMYMEILFLLRNKKYWGEKKKLIRTAVISFLIFVVIVFPMPRSDKLPSFFMFKKVAKVTSIDSGDITTNMPKVGMKVLKGDILLIIKNRELEQERKISLYSLEQINKSIDHVGAGGVEGGYRNSLLKERERFAASVKTADETIDKLTVRAPFSGYVADINNMLRKGAYAGKGSFLFTISDTSSSEIIAYADEDVYARLKNRNYIGGKVIFKNAETGSMNITLNSISEFPAASFPNGSLFDIAKGPISSILGESGEIHPKGAYYPLFFNIKEKNTFKELKHGSPCIAYITSWRSVTVEFLRWAFKGLVGEILSHFSM